MQVFVIRLAIFPNSPDSVALTKLININFQCIREGLKLEEKCMEISDNIIEISILFCSLVFNVSRGPGSKEQKESIFSRPLLNTLNQRFYKIYSG